MPNRTLALDVSSTMLRAALIESSLRSQRVLGFYAAPRRPGGDLGAELRALAASHDLHWDEVVTTLPAGMVTHRILTLPFQDRKRLDQTVPFELETHLPFELEEGVVDYQILGTDGQSSIVLAALAPKTAVRAHLDALAAAGLDPRVVDLAPLSVLNVLRMGNAEHDRAAALLTLDHDRATVALLRDGRLVGLRTLAHGMATNGDLASMVRDIRWSLLALSGDQPLTPLTLWVGGEGAQTPGLAAALEQALGTMPRGLETLAVAGVPITLRRDQAKFAAPLGLALRESGDAFGVDFRRGEFIYHREREALWRGLGRTGVLALVALLLMITSFVLEGRRLAARRDAVRAEIRSLFTAALPHVRTIVNEKAQLSSEIAALEKQRKLYGGLAPSSPRAIDLLRAFTAGVPSDTPLDLDELALDGDTMRIRGSTRAFEGVEVVKRGLAARTEFRDVEAKDVRASVDGQRVDFRLGLTVAGGGEP